MACMEISRNRICDSSRGFRIKMNLEIDKEEITLQVEEDGK